MSSEARLEFVNDEDRNLYGFQDIDIILGVNVERIWKDTRKEDKFIEVFCDVLQHEIIHGCITQFMFENMWIDGEERVVNLLCGEGRLRKKGNVWEKKRSSIRKRNL